MNIKKIIIFTLLAVGSVNAPAFDSCTNALPFDSYTFWVDGAKVSVADVRAEVDNMRKGKIGNLNLLLKERVIRQLHFVYSQSEQMELFQDVMQFLSNHSPNPEVEAIYKSRVNYYLELDKAYPGNKESCAAAREVYERSCIELISALYKSRHLGGGEKMLRIRDLLDNNFEVYPLQADLWRLMLSVSVRDNLSVAISDESVGRLLAIDDRNMGDLFYQVLGAVNSLCKLIDDGSDSYKKCDHYELWIRFRAGSF
jgi:hypothetical protein